MGWVWHVSGGREGMVLHGNDGDLGSALLWKMDGDQDQRAIKEGTGIIAWGAINAGC